MNAYETLELLAVPRAGVVARRDLLRSGWSPARIDRALKRRLIIPVVPGVYRVAGTAWTRRAAQHAALLAAGDGAHLARWSAAELLGFAESRTGPLDLLVPNGSRRPDGAEDLLRTCQTRSLPVEDRVMIDGLAVTSAPRTLLDLAARTSAPRLAELVAASVRTKSCTLQRVAAVLERRRNARGRGRLREALELLGDDGHRNRSDVELVALHAIVAAGLPRPVVAFRIVDGGGRQIAEVDLAYPELRIAIEIDGFAWHSSPAHKRADEARQNALVLAGWTVLRFSASEVRNNPDRVVVAISEALALAA